MTGKKLRERREKVGLTQQQLATYLGISITTVSRWEREECKPLRAYAKMVKVFFEKVEKGGSVSYDPVLKALENAPLDDEPLTDEDREALKEAYKDIKAGRILSDKEVRRLLAGK